MTRFAPEADAFSQPSSRPFVVMDVETTRSNVDGKQRLVSYVYTTIEHGQPGDDTHTALVDPEMPIDLYSTLINGIISMMVAGKRSFDWRRERIEAALRTRDAIFLAHNASFDVSVLRNEFESLGVKLPKLPVIYTMFLATILGYSAEGLAGRRPPASMLDFGGPSR